ncbi:flavin reductase family protein [Nocardioides dubius]|uniref:Flavin reductase family protein n=1 Tax=Nocardioides dubius TaxID=317019 RepID=A0ABN1TYV0_9ACTN
MDDDVFDSLMASLDSPLAIVTTAAEGQRAGCLIGFHSQAGITEQRYCVWLSKANHTYRVALRATHLAVHYLTADDLELAERFGTRTGEDGDKFDGLEVEPSASGVPLLAALPNRVALERIALLDDGSDHVCITCRVVSAESSGAFTPLRLSDADHLEPGHESDERAVQP